MIRNLDDAEARQFLSTCHFGSLGCYADGEQYVVPISFVLDGNRIIGQTKSGRKIDMMRTNPRVCLEAHQVHGIDDWTSVIVWASFEELNGAEANSAMGKLIDHFAGLVESLDSSRSPREVTPRSIDGLPQVDILYCLHIDRISGRAEHP